MSGNVSYSDNGKVLHDKLVCMACIIESLPPRFCTCLPAVEVIIVTQLGNTYKAGVYSEDKTSHSLGFVHADLRYVPINARAASS